MEPDDIGLNVLLVEDSPMARSALSADLERAGCTVEAVGDASLAIHRFLASKPDVILMDLALPDIDGWQAIKMIRQRARASGGDYSPWVIAHSGFEDAEARRRAFEAGCNEYVTKREGVLGALRAFAMRKKR